MYIKLQRKDLPPVLSLCQNLISHFDSRAFAFLTPVRTFTLVATAKICIELLNCHTGPDPLAACFLAGSVPKAYTLHHPVTSALVPGAG